MLYLLKMFGISLALTWVIELSVGAVMDIRSLRCVCLMLLVNLLTNPAAVLLHLLGVPQIQIEVGVILTESLVYLWFSRDEKWNISHPVQLSLAANMLSWTSGILIQI